MRTLWSDHNLPINGLAPVADAFAGTINSDVVDVSEAHQLAFLVWWGVGATGTTTFTVEACDDTTPTNTTAVAFWSRRVSDHQSSDVLSARTSRAAAGFTTTAGSNQMYLIEVDPSVLAAAGYRYVRLHGVESVDNPILGGILVLLGELRHPAETPNSMID